MPDAILMRKCAACGKEFERMLHFWFYTDAHRAPRRGSYLGEIVPVTEADPAIQAVFWNGPWARDLNWGFWNEQTWYRGARCWVQEAYSALCCSEECDERIL